MSDHYVHRPGKLKQANKEHKTGKHSTKGQLKKAIGQGKVSNVGEQRISVKDITKNPALNKMDRKNQAKLKRQQVLNAKRQISSANQKAIPRVGGFLSLSSSSKLANSVYDVVVKNSEKIERNSALPASGNSATIWIPQSKERMHLIVPAAVSSSTNTELMEDASKVVDEMDIDRALDVIRVSDAIVLVIDANSGVNPVRGERLISLLKAFGQSSLLGVIVGLEQIPLKHRNQTKKEITKHFHTTFPNEPKILTLSLDDNSTSQENSSSSEISQVIRFLGNIVSSAHPISWRENRPFMIADSIRFESESESSNLLISGYMRGGPFNVNNLVHIDGIGEFQVEKIVKEEDPFARSHVANKGGRSRSASVASTGSNVMEEDKSPSSKILATSKPEERETLQKENEIDPLSGEQTWPTEEELKQAEEEEKERINSMIEGNKKKKKRVPAGTSSYQAAWIVDSDEEQGDAEVEESDEEENVMKDEIEDNMESASMKPSKTLSSKALEQLNNMEDEEEMEDLEEEEDEKEEEEEPEEVMNEEEYQLQFPDEVNVPFDSPARMRFQKYRGLKSFRSSPWDPKENLPIHYAKIFQFSNFKRTKRRVMDGLQAPELIESGQYVTISIVGVSRSVIANRDQTRPLILNGLLKYENKVSVLHFNILKHASFTDTVKSKDPLIFYAGFRTYKAQPIFSQYNLNSDKHKYEKFLHEGRPTIASIFGPITFPPASLIVLKDSPEKELVATGALISVDPDRIILKRIILTGNPFKIHKKTVVVRDMFYNELDIAWFKPVELWTKYGRTGHIKESLGTHGHMKCTFDGVVHQNDTICMNLYKRVFPVPHSDASLTAPNKNE